MINAVAIDDEQAAIEVLNNHAGKTEFVNLIATFTNPIEAVEYINQHQVDLVFLDINMPDISGVDIPQMLINKPSIIFTTAYSEYAVRSYELNAVDYLVKPIIYSRFYVAVQKLINNNKNCDSQVLFVKSGSEYIRLNVDDILYLEAEGVYVKIVISNTNTSILCRTSLIDIMKSLSDQFIQVHRSYIINYTIISKLKYNHIYIEDVKIPVSKTHRNSLYDVISKNNIGK